MRRVVEPAAAPRPGVASEDDVRQLRARLLDLEQLVATLAATGDERDDGRVRAIRDAMWKCRKCSALLAFYDRETDVVRVRYKDHLVYAHVGPAGWIQVVCRGCGEPNEQRYATPDEVEASKRS